MRPRIKERLPYRTRSLQTALCWAWRCCRGMWYEEELSPWSASLRDGGCTVVGPMSYGRL